MQSEMRNELAHSENDDQTKTTLISRNITVLGRRTSIRLEPEMWMVLREISEREQCTIHDICTLVSVRKKEHTSLTAAIRVFLMLYFRAASTEEGHSRVGHGNFEFMIQRARISGDVLPYFSKRKTSNKGGYEDYRRARRGQSIGRESSAAAYQG